MSFSKNSVLFVLLLFAATTYSQDIQWMTWEEAAIANAKQPRKIFVDVYTDWCGWCKKMDQSTFKDSSLVEFMNKHFYAVKLNAEQKDTIVWKGYEFAWVAGGRNGYNELAAIILNKQMSFPSFVLLDQEYTTIMVSPGFKDAPTMLKQMRFAQEEAYQNGGTWEAYQSKS